VFQPASILAWLIGAPENPRGLRFQADRIAEHVAALPEELAPRAVSALRATAFRLVSNAKLVEPSVLANDPRLAQAFFAGAEAILTELNEPADADLLQPLGVPARPGDPAAFPRHAPLQRHPHHPLHTPRDERSAWQSLHLQPRNEDAQQCESFELQVAPHPTDLASRFDYFGNKQHLFTLQEPHRELTITSRSIVRGTSRSSDGGPHPGVCGHPRARRRGRGRGGLHLEQYLNATPLVPLLPEARELSEELGPASIPEFPSLDWLAIVGERFTARSFRPRGDRDLDAALRGHRGAPGRLPGLRAPADQLPAPARASGGLRERLPAHPTARRPPRLVGADASHAWVSVFIPGTGWVDYDPTNACFAGSGHIVVARGRDFRDVSPVKGLFSGGCQGAGDRRQRRDVP
jgi:hypothetical protein